MKRYHGFRLVLIALVSAMLSLTTVACGDDGNDKGKRSTPNKPDEGAQKPDDGNTKPDDGNTKPDDGNTKPDDGNTKPDDGATCTIQPGTYVPEITAKGGECDAEIVEKLLSGLRQEVESFDIEGNDEKCDTITYPVDIPDGEEGANDAGCKYSVIAIVNGKESQFDGELNISITGCESGLVCEHKFDLNFKKQ